MSATERRLTFARRAPTERPSAWRIGTASASAALDRKSTRLNSSHDQISYAVFCLKKKKKIYDIDHSKINTKGAGISTIVAQVFHEESLKTTTLRRLLILRVYKMSARASFQLVSVF